MSGMVRIIDKSSPFFNQVLVVGMIYYDYQHTGNSPDLFYLITQDGKRLKMLSTQIEEVQQ